MSLISFQVNVHDYTGGAGVVPSGGGQPGGGVPGGGVPGRVPFLPGYGCKHRLLIYISNNRGCFISYSNSVGLLVLQLWRLVPNLRNMVRLPGKLHKVWL